MLKNKKNIVYVVNVDWFFISHRLPLAKEGIRRSFNVYVLTKDTGHFSFLRKHGIHCIDINFDRTFSNPLNELKCVFLICFYYFKLKPFVVHHITIKSIIYGTIAASISSRGSRIVNAVTGLGYAFVNSKRKTSRILLKFMMRFSFTFINSNYIFQNPDDWEVFKGMGFIKNGNSIIVKGSGVDELVFCRDNFNYDNNKKVRVVLISRMLRDKGIIELIKSAQILRSEFYNSVEFILVGGIDETNPTSLTRSEILELVDQWWGKRSDIKSIYSSTDIACLPSYREGLPKSLVEAMAMECPIITTDAVGCKECVEDNVNGFIVPVGDYVQLAERLRILILDQHLRLTFGKASRIKMLAEMTLSKITKKTFEFYER
jgi:glycosyltransferase involved in cell wall biosynthesis